MKKKFIICIFLTIILITAIYFIAAAIDSYNYDMNPANGVDILEGFGAVLAIMIGAFVVFYELDLFYTVYYFLVKPKTIAKSILNIFANVSFLLIYKNVFSKDVIAPLVVFAIYIALRISSLIMPIRKSDIPPRLSSNPSDTPIKISFSIPRIHYKTSARFLYAEVFFI